jgi:hypothetical protein
MANNDILNGWNEISLYIGVTEQTAIKYGEKEGLPYAKIGGSVISVKRDLAEWVKSRYTERG